MGFVKFIIRPRSEINVSFNIKDYLLSVLGLYLLLHLTTVGIVLVAHYLSLPQPEVQKDVDFNHAFLLLIAAPLIEELAFRLFLVFSKKNLILSFTFLSYILLGFTDVFMNMTGLRIIITILLFVFCTYLFEADKIYNGIRVFWKRYFRIVFYSSNILFALFHLERFSTVINFFYTGDCCL